MEADDSLPSRPQLIDAEDIEDDVTRQRDDIAAVASEAVCSVRAFSPARPVPGIIVTASDATKAIMAITAITSMSVKPAPRSTFQLRSTDRTARTTLIVRIIAQVPSC
jgi:hypothetical protein